MAGFCVSGFTILPPNPPPPPNPAIPATIVGVGPYVNALWPDPSVLPTIDGVVVGDIIVAHMVSWSALGVVTMAGKMPSGFSLVREDFNPGTGSNRCPLYTGIAVKTAVTFDTIHNLTAYSFANPFPGGAFENLYIGVAMTAVHGSSGVDATQYTSVIGGLPATTTLAGVNCTQPGELILMLGAAGTNAGATYICAGNSAATVTTNDLPVVTAQGNNDSADRIWYFNGGGIGISPTHNVTTSDYPDPTSGYLMSMLGH